jgi:hypothetical protein
LVFLVGSFLLAFPPISYNHRFYILDIDSVAKLQTQEKFLRFEVFTAVTMKRMSSSGMWRCVDPGLTDVSEERIASIFRVEKSPSQRQRAYRMLVVSDWGLSLQPPAAAGSPLPDFYTLKMETIRSSEKVG